MPCDVKPRRIGGRSRSASRPTADWRFGCGLRYALASRHTAYMTQSEAMGADAPSFLAIPIPENGAVPSHYPAEGAVWVGADETHENCPRNALRASRRNARETVTLLGHERWVVAEVSCRGHHQVRAGVCEGRQEGQGQGSRRGRVGDRLNARQCAPPSGRCRTAITWGRAAGRESAEEAAGFEILLRHRESAAAGVGCLGWSVREVPGSLDADPARSARGSR